MTNNDNSPNSLLFLLSPGSKKSLRKEIGFSLSVRRDKVNSFFFSCPSFPSLPQISTFVNRFFNTVSLFFLHLKIRNGEKRNNKRNQFAINFIQFRKKFHSLKRKWSTRIWTIERRPCEEVESAYNEARIG